MKMDPSGLVEFLLDHLFIERKEAREKARTRGEVFI